MSESNSPNVCFWILFQNVVSSLAIHYLLRYHEAITLFDFSVLLMLSFFVTILMVPLSMLIVSYMGMWFFLNNVIFQNQLQPTLNVFFYCNIFVSSPRFSETLEFADDMAIDVPHIWLYLAELVTPVLREGGISMRELFRWGFTQHALTRVIELASTHLLFASFVSAVNLANHYSLWEELGYYFPKYCTFYANKW